jgi:type IV pilus assembly protein PilP
MLNHSTQRYRGRIIERIAHILTYSVFVLVVGCGSSGVDEDLSSFVMAEKAKPPGKIEPLPDLVLYEAFKYGAERLHDPFKPTSVLKAEAAGANRSGLQPNLKRKRGRMEQFPLDALKLVGSMQGADGLWRALIKTNKNQVVQMNKGEYLGQNHGKILRINESKVELLELIPDGLGGWEERPTTMVVDKD